MDKYVYFAIILFLVSSFILLAVLVKDVDAEAEPDPTEEPTQAPSPTSTTVPPTAKPEFVPVDIPLDTDLQEFIFETCRYNGLDPYIVLGLIAVETGHSFKSDCIHR